jgi:hypothetical protein
MLSIPMVDGPLNREVYSRPMPGKIFISYSRSDAGVADRIVQALLANEITPWIDRQELRPGESFIEGMNAGLTEASYVIVLFSAASSESEWVQREWMSATAGEIPLLPVLLKDGELPALLKDLIYFDLRLNIDDGISKIVQFFSTELGPLRTDVGRAITLSPLDTANRRQLRLVAQKCLDEDSLGAFCFDAEIEIKSLKGASVLERIISLLHQVANEGIAIQFARWIYMEKKRCVENQIAELRTSNTWDWK